MPPNEAALLVLTPEDADARPDPQGVVAGLADAGLVGAAVATDQEGEHYRVGARFFQLVTFLGCSPRLELEPPTSPVPPPAASFCHVALSEPNASPRLRWGRLTPTPRCPACGGEVASWREEAVGGAAALTCASCGTQTPFQHLNWRRSAGAGRLFVDIWSVYPREAVPAPELFQALEQASGMPWRHFYLLGEE